jgi:hypothetical protein
MDGGFLRQQYPSWDNLFNKKASDLRGSNLKNIIEVYLDTP